MSESGEEFDPPTVQGARRGPGWGWIWKALLVLATSAVAAWGALYVAVNSEGVRSRLGDEARAALARSAPTATLGNEVESDLWGRVRLGPLWVSGESPSGTWLYADAVEVRPSYRSLLKGRPRVAAVTVHGARLARSVSQRDVRAALPRRLAGADPQTRSSASGTLRLLFPDFTFGCQRLPPPGARSDETCAEGPIRASVTVDRTDAGRRIGAELTLPGGGRGDLQVRTLSGWAEIEGRIEGASASEMARWSPSLPVRVTAGRVDLTFRAQSPSPDASLGEAHLELQGRELSLEGERLAAEALGPLSVFAGGTVFWDRSQARYELKNGFVRLADRGPHVNVDAAAHWAGNMPFSIALRLDPVPFADAVDALPRAFRPAPEAPRLQGEFAAAFNARGELRVPEAIDVQGGFDLSRLRPVREGRTRVPLESAFTYRAVNEEGFERGVMIGPANPLFAPMEVLPKHVADAVTISEDAGFPGHQGFDLAEIKNSLVEAQQEGRLRGASTITQQLAKNLFLSRERTLARKVREAVVTVSLEAALPKRRLLEIYLNAIEWGPRIYGIGEAARYYFGKPPSQLTVKEAVFLATIIPNPVKYHGFYRRGTLTETWERRMEDLLGKMYRTGRIDESQLEEAMNTPLVFRSDT